ncbi:MAG: FadR family transcriptional regulator [Roseibium sp.]|nr:FadR family transcriptional regulator [Roseibium sp.]
MLTRLETKDRNPAVDALREFIAGREYAPGDRLPPERELIGHLKVTRTTLRKALDTLEREGVIWRHVGKGTFVSSKNDSLETGDLAAVVQQITPVRMMRARLAIEPAIAGEAAINASREAIARIKKAKDRAIDAESWPEYETNDDLFHHAIAEASDNILLVTLFDQLNAVRRAVALNTVIRYDDRPPRTHTSFAEHDRIYAAIEARDSKAAYEAMRQHIGSVSARLFRDM